MKPVVRESERGLTYIEMMATALIVELRRALREIRMALDLYHFYMQSDSNTPGGKHLPGPPAGHEAYPAKLEYLYEGVAFVNDVSDQKFKALRRLPRDPMTNSTDWGIRSDDDDPYTTPTSSSGAIVFDVFTKSKERALDGTFYRDW
jgi:general secretion pathway protein G